MPSQPPPGGQFDVPAASDTDLLAFRCAPALKPYLSGDDHAASVVVDARLTRVHEDNALALPPHLPGTPLLVSVAVGGKHVAHGTVIPGGTLELPFSLASLQPSASPHNVECTALLGAHTFNATSELFFLPPNPLGANTVKFEARTSSLLVKEDSTWTPIFPFGFYTSFDGFVGANFSILDDVKARGWVFIPEVAASALILAFCSINTMHFVPPFANITLLDEVLDRMEELGLWLMYDMRWCVDSYYRPVLRAQYRMQDVPKRHQRHARSRPYQVTPEPVAVVHGR